MILIFLSLFSGGTTSSSSELSTTSSILALTSLGLRSRFSALTAAAKGSSATKPLSLQISRVRRTSRREHDGFLQLGQQTRRRDEDRILRGSLHLDGLSVRHFRRRGCRGVSTFPRGLQASVQRTRAFTLALALDLAQFCTTREKGQLRGLPSPQRSCSVLLHTL